MSHLAEGDVNLVVTSPPYPMIEMWDKVFSLADPSIEGLLAADDGWGAFERMHQVLDKIWAECYRVTSEGGFVCINVGDATRSIGGEFAMYTNRARIDQSMRRLGFTPLPDILWRKQSNAPNKFMGSGMLPAGAYVTYEHEYIAIYRKGGKRLFRTPQDKQLRRESAFFWEERNIWFSDLWDLKGASQKLNGQEARSRSAAYPYELPFRLIAMLSVVGDTVLDPFMGTGSTHAAAIALRRNSVGYEIETSFEDIIEETKLAAVDWGQKRQQQRIDDHITFVKEREASGKDVKHFNEHHQVKVMTSQEKELVILF